MVDAPTWLDQSLGLDGLYSGVDEVMDFDRSGQDLNQEDTASDGADSVEPVEEQPIESTLLAPSRSGRVRRLPARFQDYEM